MFDEVARLAGKVGDDWVVGEIEVGDKGEDLGQVRDQSVTEDCLGIAQLGRHLADGVGKTVTQLLLSAGRRLLKPLGPLPHVGDGEVAGGEGELRRHHVVGRPVGGDVETVESRWRVGADGVIVGEEDRHQLLDTRPEILHDFAVLKLPSGGQKAEPFVGAGEGESVVFEPCLRMQLGDGFQGVVVANLDVHSGLIGEAVAGVLDCGFGGVAFYDPPCPYV